MVPLPIEAQPLQVVPGLGGAGWSSKRQEEIFPNIEIPTRRTCWPAEHRALSACLGSTESLWKAGRNARLKGGMQNCLDSGWASSVRSVGCFGIERGIVPGWRGVWRLGLEHLQPTSPRCKGVSRVPRWRARDTAGCQLILQHMPRAAWIPIDIAAPGYGIDPYTYSRRRDEGR
jgi:hypothetical protein